MLFAMSCDSNIPKESELTADYSISIAKFTADDSVVNLGDSTILRWEIEDDNGQIDYAYISPDIGTVAAGGGSKQITPTKSTTYTLTAYVGDEAVVTQSRQITVMAPDGSEVAEPVEDEVCDDTTDNDLDTLADCDDDDCAEFEACIVVEEPEEDPEFVYEYALVSQSPADATIGDLVTITWTTNAAYAQVFNDTTKVRTPDDFSYTFTAEETLTDIDLYMYNENGGLIKVETVSVTASEIPGFSADVAFSVSPSSVIYGQPYTVSWTVTDALTVKLDGVTSGSSGSDSISEATDSASHTLTVTDLYQNTEKFSRSVTVNKFKGSAISGLSGDIIQFVPTFDDDEFYFLTSSKIYYSSDSGNSISETITPGHGDNKALFVNSNGTLFLATTDGVYKASKDAKSSFVLLSSSGGAQINALYAPSDSTVYVGTNRQLFKVFLTTGTCSTGAVTAVEGEGDYCLESHKDFDNRKSDSQWNSAPLDFVTFVPKLNGTNVVVAIAKDGGAYNTYRSTNGGASFTELGLGAQKGYHRSNADGYLWNEDTVWLFDSESGSYKVLSLDSDIEHINFVAKISDKIFITTDTGTYYLDDLTWRYSGSDSDMDVIFDGKFVESSGGVSGFKFALIDVTRKARALNLSSGESEALEWSSSFFLISLTGAYNRFSLGGE